MTPHMQALIDELKTGTYDVDAKIVAAALNAADRSREREAVSGAEIWQAVDQAEFDALDAGMQQQVRDLWALGESIDVTPGSKARVLLEAAFDAQSKTRAVFSAAVGQSVSRAQEIGARGRVSTTGTMARTSSWPTSSPVRRAWRPSHRPRSRTSRTSRPPIPRTAAPARPALRTAPGGAGRSSSASRRRGPCSAPADF